jgi:hypothetical protein
MTGPCLCGAEDCPRCFPGCDEIETCGRCGEELDRFGVCPECGRSDEPAAGNETEGDKS